MQDDSMTHDYRVVLDHCMVQNRCLLKNCCMVQNWCMVHHVFLPSLSCHPTSPHLLSPPLTPCVSFRPPPVSTCCPIIASEWPLLSCW